MMLTKGKDALADFVDTLLPSGVEHIFVRQAKRLGLRQVVLRAEQLFSGDTFAVVVADNFLKDYKPHVTAHLVHISNKEYVKRLDVMPNLSC